jgi:SAM-dependent MidA family methyltransferase
MPTVDALDLILEEIQTSGPLPFSRFMELALYHPEQGYYQGQRSPIGYQGDYFTSPHIHRAFARCIARQITEMWQALGRPQPFYLVEFGAGSGTLAIQLLEELGSSPYIGAAIRYVGIEISKARRKEAETAIQQWLSLGQAIVSDVPPHAVPGPAVVFANEFLDALPFHLVVYREGKLMEIYVDAVGGTLKEREGPPTTGVERYFRWLGRLPLEGSRIEVNLAMLDWVHSVYRIVPQGYVLVIDYGYSSGELYGKPRPRGTAMAYFDHEVSDDLLAHPGQQDITAHVDFTALFRAALEAGFELAGYTTQAYFLANLGVGDVIAEMILAGAPEPQVDAARLAVAELVWPLGLGGFRVLALAKNCPPTSFKAFQSANLPDLQS